MKALKNLIAGILRDKGIDPKPRTVQEQIESDLIYYGTAFKKIWRDERGFIREARVSPEDVRFRGSDE